MADLIVSKHLSKGKVGQKGYWVKSHYVSMSNTGHWTKYGGGRKQEIVDLPTWVCQSCHMLQTNCLPYYLFQYPLGEYIRICVMCRHIVIRYSLNDFQQLISLVRRTQLFDTIANLITLPLPYGENGR